MFPIDCVSEANSVREVEQTTQTSEAEGTQNPDIDLTSSREAEATGEQNSEIDQTGTTEAEGTTEKIVVKTAADIFENKDGRAADHMYNLHVMNVLQELYPESSISADGDEQALEIKLDSTETTEAVKKPDADVDMGKKNNLL